MSEVAVAAPSALRCFGVLKVGKIDHEALFTARCDAEWHAKRYGGVAVLVWGELAWVPA